MARGLSSSAIKAGRARSQVGLEATPLRAVRWCALSPPARLTDVQNPRVILIEPQLRRGGLETPRWLVGRLVGEIERSEVHADDAAGTQIPRRLQSFLGVEMHDVHDRRRVVRTN